VFRREESNEVRAILFDLDETLCSREDAFWEWIEAEASTCLSEKPLNRELVATLDARGRGDKRALLTYLNDAFGWGAPESQRLQRFRAGLTRFIRADPAISQMLARLAQRYRLGVVTNGSSETQRAKLERLGFAPLFDKIIVSEEVGCRKPDSAIFRLAIEGWEVPAASVLVVGDDPVADVEGARAAGMQALRVQHQDGIPSLSMLENWLVQRKRDGINF